MIRFAFKDSKIFKCVAERTWEPIVEPTTFVVTALQSRFTQLYACAAARRRRRESSLFDDFDFFIKKNVFFHLCTRLLEPKFVLCQKTKLLKGQQYELPS